MKKEIEKLFKEPPISIEGRVKKAYNFSQPSKSFDFYQDQFNGEAEFEIGSSRKIEDLKNCPPEMQEIIPLLQKNTCEDSLIVEIGGSKHQRTGGFPYFFLKNYIPLDISLSSMISYSEMYDEIGIACDAQSLPFIDKSIDAIFTHTFLEHPMDPDKVVKEIHRVLKDGGLIIHADAWHCRWWKTYGVYGVKSWNNMKFTEKLLYLVIVITEFKPFRFPIIVFNRLITEVFTTNKRNRNLKYKKLTPNYDLKIYSDEDAAASIDPLNLIRFYESRGYNLIPKKSFIKRLFFRDIYVCLKKPESD